MQSTQLTQPKGFKPSKRIVFSKVENGTIPGSTPPINYKRIRLSVKNSDGSVGDLILPTTEVFSFGVQENKDMGSGKVNGYTMPLCLWSKNGATDEEKDFSDTFNNIVDHIKKYLLDKRDDIEHYELEDADLKRFNPLYWKKERGKVVEGLGPTLYAKLIYSKKSNKILTLFSDHHENTDIDPMSLFGKYCFVQGAIKIESIFIGNKISLQVKLYEAVVRRLDSGIKKLLSRPTNSDVHKVINKESEKESDKESDKESEKESDSDSDSGSLSDKSEEKPSPVKKKVVKKRVVRRKKAN
tara:strand:+ start:458 stop:1351 length:894 start_codon:yes stop_codon:yes gene_type:complete